MESRKAKVKSNKEIGKRAERKALSAERKAKPAGSEQRAAIRSTDYKTASIKKSTPPPGFLNSDLPTAYCYLPTSFPLCLGVLAFRPVGPTARRARIILVEVVLWNILSVRAIELEERIDQLDHPYDPTAAF